MYKLMLVVAAGLAVAGCGSNIITQLAAPPGKSWKPNYLVQCLHDNKFLYDSEGDDISNIASRLMQGVVPLQYWKKTGDSAIESETVEIEQLKGQPGYVNLFLDCYIAHVAQGDLRGRLLRGHIVTTLLAQYASATLIAKERAAKADDAATIIFHIRRASIQLAAVSPDALEALYSLTPEDGKKEDETLRGKIGKDASQKLLSMLSLDLPNFRNAQRAAAVFDIGTDIARIDGRAAANTAGTIFDIVSTTAVSGGFNPSVVPKLQGLLESAVAGLSLTAQSLWYGSAFMRDAQESLLIDMKNPQNMGPLWLAWQTRINAACDSLKAVADTRAKPCEPTVGEMVDFLKREYPRHPYLAALKERAAIDVKK